ncbi:MAG: MarR family winged helix-turn-helix transcriptional regulator [Chloroflexota bacterium]|nr:MarR family winged helix-turn-helix transcriptional regulator [Chloroflexota bacterium]
MKDDSQEQLGYLLVQVCKAHRNRAQAALSEIGLHAGQEMILMHLYDAEGLTQSQLVESLCVEPPTVTKMLQRMEAVGIVERRQDAEDARVSRVYLTPNGRALETQVCAVWRQLDDDTVAGLTDVEQALLRRLLQQVHTNLTK